jgi:hypothetical protein
VKTPKIYAWKEIEEDFKKKLVLGNGASIAVWDGFKYDSLYDEAADSGIFSPKLSAYLGDIGTQTVTAEKIVEVGYAISDNCQGVRAFSFGRSTQLIAMKQTTYVAARF